MRGNQILIAGALIAGIAGSSASAQTARFPRETSTPAPASAGASATPSDASPSADQGADAAPAARRTFTRGGAPQAKQAFEGTTLAMVDADANGIISRAELEAARKRVAEPEPAAPAVAGAGDAPANADIAAAPAQDAPGESSERKSSSRSAPASRRLTLPPVPGTGAGAAQLLAAKPADIQNVVFRPRDTLPPTTRTSHPSDLVHDAIERSRAKHDQQDAAQEHEDLDDATDAPDLSAREQRLERFRQRMTARYDSDNDGRLSRAEYGRAKVALAKRRAAVIRKYDTDGDGRLSSAERDAARARIAAARTRSDAPSAVASDASPAQRDDRAPSATTGYASYIRIESLDD